MPKPIIRAPTQQRVQLKSPLVVEVPAPVVAPVTAGGGAYFTSEHTNYVFIPSGCLLLDLVMGGGWPAGVISNIMGNSSTGKTLIAIEAIANLFRTYPKGQAYYREAEGAAFDYDYANALGVPFDRVDFSNEIRTVEAWFTDLEKVLANKRADEPGIYVTDSLDGLSSDAEIEREITDGTYSGEKAKKIGETFRRLAQPMKEKKLHLMIISQVRDKIGARFGYKEQVSGGRALEFYCGQRVWLTHMKKLAQTVSKVERVWGVRINAECRKNKVGTPWRDCEFNIRFGYGIEDMETSLKFLEDLGKPYKGEQVNSAHLRNTVIHEWYELERRVMPVKGKYV